jgi:hypothetical protein
LAIVVIVLVLTLSPESVSVSLVPSAREAIPTLERCIAIHERERHDTAGLAKLGDALALARTQEAAHATE